MSRLTKIPVLGRTLRVLSAFFRAPARFDALFNEIDLLKRKLELEQARSQQLEQTLAIHDEELQRQLQALESEQGRIRVHSRLLDHMGTGMRTAEERLDSAEGRMLHTDHRLDSAEERMLHTDHRLDSAEGRLAQHDVQFKQIYDGEPAFMNVVLNRLYTDSEVLTRLNRELSGQPTIWGDPARLHIAKSAAVYACLFNTNSGSITVGEYTFAGSRVSLLAGSHDPNLRGFLRRDAEIKSGCDIVVGNGVWLASGCTLLGPCEVGDNAVIAAGAVVTPGTKVPANAIYGGVPAHKIANLDFSVVQDANNLHVQRALEREGGALFIEGWTEKQIFPGTPEVGHWLCGAAGTVLVARVGVTLRCRLDDAEAAELVVDDAEGERRFPMKRGEALELALSAGEGPVEPVTFRLEADAGRLFAACAMDKGKGMMNGGSQDE